jgi:Flp pilus assembly pilin Flp
MSYGKLWQYVASALMRAKSQGGQALGEYALVLALIALAAVVGLTAIGAVIGGPFQHVADVIGL